MYRFLFSPKWLGFHLLVIVVIVAMVNLGFWQLRRLDERKAFNRVLSARIAEAPAPLHDVLTPGADPGAVEWRSVTASGTYVPAEQFAVVNRSQDGIGGTMVVTPLRLTDGRLLLVERGFMPGTTTPPAALSGTVEIVGRLRPSEKRHTGQLSDPSSGVLHEAQRVDIPRLAPQLSAGLEPMYVELTASRPAEPTPYPAPVTLPELTEGPHLSYAVQWFMFSVAVIVGWVLAVRHSINTRRRGGPPTAADVAPEAVGAAPPTSPG
jgi:cytochrome oxidase assembly protein ShyY1